jgi:hypothetical protein
MLHHRSLFAADVSFCVTPILPYITGKRNKIKMRKEEEAEMITMVMQNLCIATTKVISKSNICFYLWK